MRALAVTVLLVALVLVGCADPYEPVDTISAGPTADRAGEQKKNPARQPPVNGELPGTVPQQLQEPKPTRFPGAGRTPRQTITRGAALYGNWTSETAPRRFGAIAAICVGEARAQLRQVAADARADPQQAGARSSARLLAVDLHGRGPRRRAVIVTREHVEAGGIAPEGPRYRVTLAQLERRGDRWVISQWTPQP